MSADKILILGVTASGKATLGFELAKRLGGEIISVDSMKVYKRMDIGTAKASAERQKLVKYHLVDVVEPWEAFSVDQFLEQTEAAKHEILAAGKPVIAVGGTAMYIKALLFGLFNGPGEDKDIRSRLKDEVDKVGLVELHKRMAAIDPEAGDRIHPNDERRIIRALEVYELTGKPITHFQQQWSETKMLDNWCIIGLRRDKEIESRRINARVKKMVEMGLLDEVKSLASEELPISKQARAAIGYAEVFDHLEGKMTFEDAVERIKINTRQLAKSQRTWFKTFRNVHWINMEEDTTAEEVISKTLEIIEQF